jgi:hypothetical protein
MLRPALALSMLATTDALSTSDYPHQQVHDAVVAAFNRPSLLPSLSQIFASDAVLCDPYPNCVHSSANITTFLTMLNASVTDAYMLPAVLTSDTR